MERRTFLSAGGASVLAFATAFPSTTGETGPTDIVDEYYRRADAAESADAFADRVPELAHSVSPLPTVAEDIPEALDGALEQTLVDADVVDRDISGEEIRATSDFLAGSVDDDGIEAVASDNAVVAVTLETESVSGGTFALEWLVAPEDGEWRLVWFDERDGPEAVARRFFRQVTSIESPGALDDPVARFSHSASPLVNVAEYTPWYFRSIRQYDLAGTNLVREDISSRVIASRFTPLVSWASRDEIEALAEENAVVALSLRDDELGRFRQRLLVAPEYDEWRIVWF